MTSFVSAPPTVFQSVTGSPTTGQTVTIPDGPGRTGVYLTPAGALLALTINFPSDASTITGQVIYICITQVVTTLTLSVSGGSILNGLTSFAGNDCVSFIKMAPNVWARITASA